MRRSSIRVRLERSRIRVYQIALLVRSRRRSRMEPDSHLIWHMRIIERGSLGKLGMVAFAVCSASSALAQSHSQTREGFVGSVGLGVGSATVTCANTCGGDRDNAPAGYLRLGGAATPHLILAGELNAWSRRRTESFSNSFIDPTTNQIVTEEQRATARLSVITVNAVAQWYPQPAGGFFVLGGLGVGRFQAHAESATLPLSYSAHTTALGYQVGTGYDIPLSGILSLTPYATYFAAGRGKLDSESDRVGANALHVGVGLTWH
jgi:hypothetical protein